MTFLVSGLFKILRLDCKAMGDIFWQSASYFLLLWEKARDFSSPEVFLKCHFLLLIFRLHRMLDSSSRPPTSLTPLIRASLLAYVCHSCLLQNLNACRVFDSKSPDVSRLCLLVLFSIMFLVFTQVFHLLHSLFLLNGDENCF